MINKGVKNSICIKCGSSFDTVKQVTNYLKCISCGFQYPLIRGVIPVMVTNPQELLARTYLLYEKQIREQESIIQRAQAYEPGKDRFILKRIISASQYQIRQIEKIQEEIGNFITLKDIAKYSTETGSSGYTNVNNYLRRDWSHLPEAEKEIQAIICSVKEEINSFSGERESVVVAGAGMGRLVWELTDSFGEVYAIDNSVTMAYYFHTLLEKDIPFYDVNLKRVFNEKDSVQKITASLACEKDNHYRKRLEGMNYIIGNMLQLPLKEYSVSAVISVYFTDVFPLRYYIREIKRLLKPGGIFVHYGPLEYHFKEIPDMLSADEVKNIFIEEGFEVLSDRKEKNTNLESPVSMLSISYTNWIFAAVKKETEPDKASVRPDTIVNIEETIKIEKEGFLKNYTSGKELIKLVLPSGERLEIKAAIFEILLKINGEKSIHQLIQEFLKEYEIEDNSYTGPIEETLNFLLKKGVLKIQAT